MVFIVVVVVCISAVGGGANVTTVVTDVVDVASVVVGVVVTGAALGDIGALRPKMAFSIMAISDNRLNDAAGSRLGCFFDDDECTRWSGATLASTFVFFLPSITN